MSGSEIQALMALLDDPDEGVYNHVRSRLMEQGEAILPMLQAQQVRACRCEMTAGRLEELMSGMMEERALVGLKGWLQSETPKVFDGALWLESVCGFGGQREEGEAAFSALRRDVWLELNEELTALEQVRVVNHVLYSSYGFERATLTEQDGRHAVPAQVLIERKGSPLGLGVVYLALAESLDLSLHAVAVSGLFFLAYVDPTWDASVGNEPPVWFYVNPFDGGQMVAPEELQMIARELEPDWAPRLLDAKQVCLRMGQYLIRLCRESDQTPAAHRLSRLLEVFGQRPA